MDETKNASHFSCSASRDSRLRLSRDDPRSHLLDTKDVIGAERKLLVKVQM